MERKKTSLFILGLSILLLSVVGVTYAYWTLTLEQTDEDNLATSCFDVVLTEENNAINLEKAYPIVDKEGEELTPYTFKLKNKCNANVKYQINLETLNTVGGVSIEEDRLASHYIKEKLNEAGKDGSIRLLTDNKQVKTTLKDAEESYKLMTGYMEADGEKTFELRLWMDENITVNDVDAMEKTFASKITIVATYAKEAKKTLEETILALDIENEVSEDTGATGLYKVEHTGAEITYTTDPFYIERLQKPEYRYAGKEPNNYVDVGEEEKYELILCVEAEGMEMCQNVSMVPDLAVNEFYTDSASCEAKKTEVEPIIEEEYKSSPYPMTYTLNCSKSHLWRIIGLVNTPEGQRVKLIKDTSIGNYSWDTSASNVNNGYGVNEWSQSDLMKLLNSGYETNKDQICEEDQCTNDNLVNNSLYWDGGNGQCYDGFKNSASSCSFTNTKMPDNLKNMIDTVTWNTGSNGETSYDNIKVNKFYDLERSNNTGDICKSGSGGNYCTDTIDRTTSWKGKVGLVYPSDYGYATSGGKETENNRTSCFETNLYSWSSSNECYENDWLLSSTIDWTISPFAYSAYSYDVFAVYSDGHVDGDTALNAEGVRPSVYLSSNVIVLSGDGSKNEPYILEAP